MTTAYLITSTLATPLYGKLSDMYGRKPFYLAAISIFVVGSWHAPWRPPCTSWPSSEHCRDWARAA
ncbi:hypothetical protein [Nocardia sp. NBC_01377]|uniref:hypothetical protein n=1 Tax=Nocardia sp. NBC_01377 TaxID=2903595 RepID=UPI00386AE64A